MSLQKMIDAMNAARAAPPRELSDVERMRAQAQIDRQETARKRGPRVVTTPTDEERLGWRRAAGLLTVQPPGVADELQVLGLSWPCTKKDVQSAYRTLAKVAHPDRGGTEEAMRRLNTARDAILKLIKK